ncbi:hypothetical protein [Yoonia sp. 2307UL14-13]|uniref:hypothetical protein n=1 Tax=Yoonia sp. 2307UL14-13 TaxID=3126506 RepID=UPI0030A432E2
MKRLLSFLISWLLAWPVGATAQEVEVLTDITQQRIENFERRMKDWGTYYEEMAGAGNLWLEGDEEVIGGGLLVYGGDWAVFDRRMCSGAYGVSHESGEIWPIELVNPTKYDTTCLEPAIMSDVSTLTLMRRYQWFSSLFINWSHVLTPSPLGIEGWETPGDIDADYEKEIAALSDDPYLALYWLMHFGFTMDVRYDDVKKIIAQNQLSGRFEFIDDAMAFFDHQTIDTNVPIENSYDPPEEFTDIFLKRRAYLVWLTRSYDYAAGADGVAAWWHSIAIYPHAEPYMIRRMRWLGNNLEKFDQWSVFSGILDDYDKPGEVSLLSYVQAQNPTLGDGDRQRHANRFIAELVNGEQIWKDPTDRLFGQAMIYALRDQITDRALFQEVTDIYFADDTIGEKFQDINAILNGPEANAGLDAVREVVERLAEAIKDYDRWEATDDERAALFETIDDALSDARDVSPDLLFNVVANLNQQVLQERALYFLYTQDIPGKADTLTALFARLEPSPHDIPDIFADRFPDMFDGPDDPNVEWARQMILHPDRTFRNTYAAESSREAAMMFFLKSVHWDENFAFFIDVLRDDQFNDVEDLKYDIFATLMSREYDTEINPTDQMSRVQLETLFETVTDLVRRPELYQYGFIDEAIRTFSIENPKAKDWLERHYNNRKWLNTFPARVPGHFGDVREDVTWSIEFGLEYIAEREKK